MNSIYLIIFLNVFHEFDLPYYLSHDYESSKLMDNNWSSD